MTFPAFIRDKFICVIDLRTRRTYQYIWVRQIIMRKCLFGNKPVSTTGNTEYHIFLVINYPLLEFPKSLRLATFNQGAIDVRNNKFFCFSQFFPKGRLIYKRW